MTKTPLLILTTLDCTGEDFKLYNLLPKLKPRRCGHLAAPQKQWSKGDQLGPSPRRAQTQVLLILGKLFPTTETEGSIVYFPEHGKEEGIAKKILRLEMASQGLNRPVLWEKLPQIC